MSGIFINILSMSFTAGYCIAAVILIRFFLRRQPKIFSYLLWSIVLFRLVCPVSISSPYSLLKIDTTMLLQERILGRSAEEGTVWQGNGYPDTESAAQEGGMQGNEKDGNVPMRTADKKTEAARAQTMFMAAAWIWFAGMSALIFYGAGTYFALRHRLRKAEHVTDNLYRAKGISTPFVFGMIHPRIYMPDYLSETEQRYVLEHEKVHISRKDYLIKMIAWAAVCLHWFNPLVWLAFTLMENDMEMSCDEAVLRRIGTDVRQEYSQALLALSCERTNIGGCPLAFGEGKVKNRILNILTYRKKALVTVVALIAVLSIAAVGLLLDPSGESKRQESEAVTGFATDYANAFVARDGNTLVGMYMDEDTAFEDVPMLEGTDGAYSFGYSSPWPDEFRMTVEEEEQKIQIRYYAWTSDPHVTVWKEEVSFTETEDGYRVTGSVIKFYDEIASREEFMEAYRVADAYQFADYVERGYVDAINAQSEYDREAGEGTDRNAVYRNPDTAAEWILNLSGGESEVSSSSSGQADVKYTFTDGSSVTIPMYNANHTSETGNTEEPDDGQEEAGDVWIVDLKVWNE